MGPEKWKGFSLGDAPLEILDGDRGKNYPSQDELCTAGDCLFLSAKNVRSDGFEFSECQFITADKDALLRKGKLTRNDIVLTTRGTVGNIAFYDHKVPFESIRINSGMVIIRADDQNLLPPYCHWLMRTLQSDFLTFASGSAQPQLPIRDLKDILVRIPSLPEQRAIADVLSSLGDKIDLLHRQNKTLEAMAETLFRQWFVEEADDDWEERPLSSIATFLNGLACQKFPPENALEQLPVLKIKELSGGVSESSDFASSNVKPEYIVTAGDVIFAWSASLMVKLWDGPKCVLNQHLFRVTSTEFPKWFYFLWCKHHLGEFISISRSHATTMGHIKRGDLDKAVVVVASPGRLAEMSVVQVPIIDKQIAIAKQIRTLEKLRDTLLPKLMSGEVRVAV